MSSYKKSYYKLFNKVSDIILQLQEAQLEAEALFINSERNDDPDRKAILHLTNRSGGKNEN